MGRLIDVNTVEDIVAKTFNYMTIDYITIKDEENMAYIYWKPVLSMPYIDELCMKVSLPYLIANGGIQE